MHPFKTRLGVGCIHGNRWGEVVLHKEQTHPDGSEDLKGWRLDLAMLFSTTRSGTHLSGSDATGTPHVADAAAQEAAAER